jgi:hypothetical protein
VDGIQNFSKLDPVVHNLATGLWRVKIINRNSIFEKKKKLTPPPLMTKHKNILDYLQILA